MKPVFIADIDLEASPRVRDGLREDTIEEYANLYRTRQKLPPPDIFIQGRTLLLADGRHRLEAARRAELKQLACNDHTGGFDDCLLFALRSNLAHGLRRSHCDKRKAVETALRTWPTVSNRLIAERASVDDHLVATVRATLESSHPEKRVDAKGVSQPAVKPKPKLVFPKLEHPLAAPVAPVKDARGVEELLDATGYPIPVAVVALWVRAKEVNQILSTLTIIKSAIREAEADNDPLWREVNFSAVTAHLENVFTGLSVGKPYAVCTSCQGRLPDKCALCKGRGVISKFRYDTVVPKEIKEMRSQLCKK